MVDLTITGDDDDILSMFFDEEFVPHAFVDILLSNALNEDQIQTQSVSSLLLTRLDFYTKNLTKELESTIWNLDKLSQTLPRTWASSRYHKEAEQNDSSLYSTESLKSSKLEYYLDTLASAVRALETGMHNVTEKLSDLDNENNHNTNVRQQLQSLMLIKERIEKVVYYLEQVRTVTNISTVRENNTTSTGTDLSITDFRTSLKALEDTIDESLGSAIDNEAKDETNKDLIGRIDSLSELKCLFKGLDKFFAEYSNFSESIKSKAQSYLSTKDIDDGMIS
ncbi:Cog7p [Saccharomyces cerevisiae YJM1400]|nr:Cog7p [Saccharomyces cerevisiae YJM1479]AJS28765.1 Cog7p [Saccharomyces cerevisiae YJM1400]CAI4476820.1 BAP_1a_G0017180.mRNA.1.CDS.1 [Saccharomyces cerevisiae]CAI7120440.1 BAP_1a_G0017180.mRNA.1.CDS.1 [Saccharomyces cerevisiae]